jgi:hypothetical protein
MGEKTRTYEWHIVDILNKIGCNGLFKTHALLLHYMHILAMNMDEPTPCLLCVLDPETETLCKETLLLLDKTCADMHKKVHNFTLEEYQKTYRGQPDYVDDDRDAFIRWQTQETPFFHISVWKQSDAAKLLTQPACAENAFNFFCAQTQEVHEWFRWEPNLNSDCTTCLKPLEFRGKFVFIDRYRRQIVDILNETNLD